MIFISFSNTFTKVPNKSKINAFLIFNSLFNSIGGIALTHNVLSVHDVHQQNTAVHQSLVNVGNTLLDDVAHGQYH